MVLSSQVWAQVQTEVTGVHWCQQHRLPLSHSSQSLARGPHGNEVYSIMHSALLNSCLCDVFKAWSSLLNSCLCGVSKAWSALLNSCLRGVSKAWFVLIKLLRLLSFYWVTAPSMGTLNMTGSYGFILSVSFVFLLDYVVLTVCVLSKRVQVCVWWLCVLFLYRSM